MRGQQGRTVAERVHPRQGVRRRVFQIDQAAQPLRTAEIMRKSVTKPEQKEMFFLENAE